VTYSFDPQELTGALVLELRTRAKMSRAEFSQRAGFTGKSTARLSNIENKESWKPGDREAIARVLTDIQGGNFDPRYHEPAASTTHGEVPPAPVTDLLDGDDSVEDLLADVVGPHPRIEANAPTPLPIPTVELLPDPVPEAVPRDGVYSISNGEQQTWKRCRRKWWLTWYRELRLRNVEFVGVRAIGDRVHRALAAWYAPEGEPRVDPRNALERAIVEDWTQVTKLAQERGLGEDRLREFALEYAESTNLERAMVEGYVQWLEETGADSELRVIASETPMTAELEVRTHAGDDRPLRVIGLLDTRVYRVTDGRRLFLDHKTVGDLNTPAITLPQNEQMLHYDLLEWLNTPEGEARCDGALYNMIRRVKRSAKAKPPFYDRVEVHHNVHELESYKRRLLATVADVMQAVDALDAGVDHRDVVYPTPKSDCRWDCDFFAVCNMFDDGSPGVEDMLSHLYVQGDPRDRYRGTDGKTL
jgi:hypothetical protein